MRRYNDARVSPSSLAAREMLNPCLIRALWIVSFSIMSRLSTVGIGVAVAGAGLWVELYLSALRIRAVPGETLIHLVGWLYMASATLVIALSGALVLGFLWFFLESRVRRQELTAAARLLEGIS